MNFGYASSNENNTLIFGAFRWPSQFREYSGPDSLFAGVVTRPLPAGTGQGLIQKIGIDPSILPGSYRFFGLVRDPEGNYSDSVRFDCFILNPEYPDLALDTPVNGLAALNVIASNAFPFRFRAVGNGLAFLQIQWFDSTKTIGLSPAIQFPLNPIQPIDTVRGILDFPPVNSKNLFLRAILSNNAQRRISWWVPFRKSL
jgi:hypothetical protein